jgi:hypothetical protein
MNTTLKDMMSARADAAPGPNLDVDAAIRKGRRRLWRNRAVGGTAVCAAAAALAVTAPTVLPDGGSSDVGWAGGIGERLAATYATGSEIHYGDQTVDVAPQDVSSFLQTDDGFVFTTPGHGVYFTDGGVPEQIGQGDLTGKLVADDAGGYVAWVDDQAQPLPEFVVYDTGSQSAVVRTSKGIEPGMGTAVDSNSPAVLALDGHTVYWHDAHGIVAWDLTTGDRQVVLPGAASDELQDAAAGRLLRYDVGAGANGLTDLVVSADPRATQPRFPGLGGTLSPNADYLASQTIGGGGDSATSELVVSDVASGDNVTPTTAGYRNVVVAQWLGDDAFAAAGITADGSVDLLNCSIPRGSCDIAAADVGTEQDVRLPSGLA